MKGFGLIGYPLSHSFSRKYFNDKFRKEQITGYYYENFPLTSIDGLPGLISGRPELAGLNVTIPYKEKILPFLHHIDNDAAAIGAVNTIKIFREASGYYIEGYNTDAYGFYNSISPYLKEYHRGALILGTGGSSKAVAYALKKNNIKVIFVSRKPYHDNHISYEGLTENILKEHQIIVNATPMGMFPEVSSFPDIPYNQLTEKHILFDLVYNPSETLFLKKGKNAGAVVINGLDMLHLQAERSWEIWKV